LDDAVFDLYQLDREDRVIAGESVAKARAMIFEGQARYEELVSPPSEEALTGYAAEVVRTVNSFLRTRGTRHLEAVVCPSQSEGEYWPDNLLLTSVRFVMAPGGPHEEPIVKKGSAIDVERLMTLLRTPGQNGNPPYLNERRQLRIYGAYDLFVVKPAEVRYWTRTMGLNDADVILSDHWLSGRHATVA
jgi:hypothetical protein